MPAYFQVKGSTNLRKIAVVSRPTDIDSFKRDANWYELTEEEYNALFKKEEAPKEVKKTKKKEVE